MDPRAKVESFTSPNAALPVGTELVARGVAGEPVENRQVNWYKYGQGPSVGQGETFKPTGPGWYRVEVQVKPHVGDSLPSGSWRDPATGVLGPFERGVSRAASGHQLVQ